MHDDFLGVYRSILGLMSLTLFQGHRCVRNMNCKLRFFRFLSTYFKCCILFLRFYVRVVSFSLNNYWLACLLQVSPHILTDPNEISKHLPVRTEAFEKLEFPDTASSPLADSTEQEAARWCSAENPVVSVSVCLLGGGGGGASWKAVFFNIVLLKMWRMCVHQEGLVININLKHICDYDSLKQ